MEIDNEIFSTVKLTLPLIQYNIFYFLRDLQGSQLFEKEFLFDGFPLIPLEYFFLC